MTMTDNGVAVQEDIRVLIVDDHTFSDAVTWCSATEDGIDVVGEGGDGDEGVRRAEELAPDVVLMDVRMPRVSRASSG